MYFGSKYVYKYEHSSDESVSDEEEEVSKNVVATYALPTVKR
jgi:hypothetical protein